MRIESEASRSSELLAAVQAGMRRHAELHVPQEQYNDLTLVARDDSGRLVGAGLGETGRGWLHISVVWVDELLRRQRLGTQLVLAMESEALQRGCHAVYLDTFSYQAKPFYEKLGYEVFGTLDDYPLGHQRFYMRKRLSEA
jgi:ribosomal protein S18 acetylase RimI-like enzyme